MAVREPGGILVINAGSSSIKAAVFDAELSRCAEVALTGIGSPRPELLRNGRPLKVAAPDHQAALRLVLAELARSGQGTGSEADPSEPGAVPGGLPGLRAVAHRVVHGGARLSACRRVTPELLTEIEACIPLAPLHNPHNLAAIRALADLVPGLPQFACFDTAFHLTNPEVALRYALPPDLHEAGIRRYGFHGISYASLLAEFPARTGKRVPSRFLALHLGNGASICAIRDGRSLATTMGYSPVSGLTMGTRCGDIDANAVLRMVEEMGLAAARETLNHRAGLHGLSGGEGDMRLLENRAPTDRGAALAIDHFCHWALRHAGGLIAAMGGLDALAFTGGIGENSALVRGRIMKGLEFAGLHADTDANLRGQTQISAEASPVAAYVIPAREERQIAGEALRALRNAQG